MSSKLMDMRLDTVLLNEREIKTLLSDKQDALRAGTGIVIKDGVISSSAPVATPTTPQPGIVASIQAYWSPVTSKYYAAESRSETSLITPESGKIYVDIESGVSRVYNTEQSRYEIIDIASKEYVDSKFSAADIPVVGTHSENEEFKKPIVASGRARMVYKNTKFSPVDNPTAYGKLPESDMQLGTVSITWDNYMGRVSSAVFTFANFPSGMISSSDTTYATNASPRKLAQSEAVYTVEKKSIYENLPLSNEGAKYALIRETKNPSLNAIYRVYFCPEDGSTLYCRAGTIGTFDEATVWMWVRLDVETNVVPIEVDGTSNMVDKFPTKGHYLRMVSSGGVVDAMEDVMKGDTIQLGTGENDTPNSLQFKDYPLVDPQGHIYPNRIQFSIEEKGLEKLTMRLGDIGGDTLAGNGTMAKSKPLNRLYYCPGSYLAGTKTLKDGDKRKGGKIYTSDDALIWREDEGSPNIPYIHGIQAVEIPGWHAVFAYGGDDDGPVIYYRSAGRWEQASLIYGGTDRKYLSISKIIDVGKTIVPGPKILFAFCVGTSSSAVGNSVVVFRSDDSGMTWHGNPVLDVELPGVNTIKGIDAVVPYGGGNFYMAVRTKTMSCIYDVQYDHYNNIDGVVYKTERKYGCTVYEYESTDNIQTKIESLVYSSGRLLYGASNNLKGIRSWKQGSQWPCRLDDINIQKDGIKVWKGTYVASTSSGLMCSTNSGKSWTYCINETDGTDLVCGASSVYANSSYLVECGDVLYAAMTDGSIAYTTNGKNWWKSSVGTINIQSMISNGDRLLVLTTDGSLYRYGVDVFTLSGFNRISNRVDEAISAVRNQYDIFTSSLKGALDDIAYRVIVHDVPNKRNEVTMRNRAVNQIRVGLIAGLEGKLIKVNFPDKVPGYARDFYVVLNSGEKAQIRLTASAFNRYWDEPKDNWLNTSNGYAVRFFGDYRFYGEDTEIFFAQLPGTTSIFYFSEIAEDRFMVTRTNVTEAFQ